MLSGPCLLAFFLALLAIVSGSSSHFLSYHCYVAPATNGYRCAACCLFAAGFAALQAILWSKEPCLIKPQSHQTIKKLGSFLQAANNQFRRPVDMLLMPSFTLGSWSGKWWPCSPSPMPLQERVKGGNLSNYLNFRFVFILFQCLTHLL